MEPSAAELQTRDAARATIKVLSSWWPTCELIRPVSPMSTPTSSSSTASSFEGEPPEIDVDAVEQDALADSESDNGVPQQLARRLRSGNLYYWGKKTRATQTDPVPPQPDPHSVRARISNSPTPHGARFDIDLEQRFRNLSCNTVCTIFPAIRPPQWR